MAEALARRGSDEHRYLTGQLAADANWAGLWRVITGLPVTDAVEAMRLLGGWEPADAAGRALAARLAAAGPDATERARHAMHGWPPDAPALTTVRIDIPGNVRAGSFSPDGRRLAVVTTPPAGDGNSGPSVFDIELPHGSLVQRYDYEDRFPASVVHLGDALVAAVRGAYGRRAAAAGPDGRLDSLAHGRRETIAEFPDDVLISCLTPYGDGFAALERRSGGNRLLFFDREGQVVSSAWPDRGRRDEFRAECLAVDPGSGRLAIGGSGGLVVAGSRGDELVARSRSAGDVSSVCLAAPDLLATIGSGTFALWQVKGHRLACRRSRRVSELAASAVMWGVVAIPRRGEIATIRERLPTGAQVSYFRTRNLASTGGSHGLAGPVHARAMWGSPDGGCHAVGGDGFVDVAFTAHPLASLAGRPVAVMTQGDLAAIAAALRDATRFPAARPFLELLEACLAYRLAVD